MAAEEDGFKSMAIAHLGSKEVAPDRITLYQFDPDAEDNSTSLVVERDFAMRTITGATADRDRALSDDSGGDILWLRNEDENWGRKMSATGLLDARFSLGPKENARRREAKGIQSFMRMYDALL